MRTKVVRVHRLLQRELDVVHEPDARLSPLALGLFELVMRLLPRSLHRLEQVRVIRKRRTKRRRRERRRGRRRGRRRPAEAAASRTFMSASELSIEKRDECATERGQRVSQEAARDGEGRDRVGERKDKRAQGDARHLARNAVRSPLCNAQRANLAEMSAKRHTHVHWSRMASLTLTRALATRHRSLVRASTRSTNSLAGATMRSVVRTTKQPNRSASCCNGERMGKNARSSRRESRLALRSEGRIG